MLFRSPQDLNTHEFLHAALTRLIAEGYTSEDKLITVLAGNYGSECGATFIEISTPKNMLR